MTSIWAANSIRTLVLPNLNCSGSSWIVSRIILVASSAVILSLIRCAHRILYLVAHNWGDKGEKQGSQHKKYIHVKQGVHINNNSKLRTRKGWVRVDFQRKYWLSNLFERYVKLHGPLLATCQSIHMHRPKSWWHAVNRHRKSHSGGGLDRGADLGVSKTVQFGLKTTRFQQYTGGFLKVLNALNLFRVKDAVSKGVVITG